MTGDPQREFDEHMDEIRWTNAALNDIARQEEWLASVRDVWRDNRHEERERLPLSGQINDGAWLKSTASGIAAVLAQNGGDL